MSRKVNVGIIYSESSNFSNESKYLALYLCGLMSSTTYTHTYVVPLQPDGLPLKDLPTGRILYSPRNIVAGKPIEVPVCEKIELISSLLISINVDITRVATLLSHTTVYYNLAT